MSVVPQQPYPNAEQVMNRARAFVNDAFQGGAGRILTDKAPFTGEYLNSALEELAQIIRNRGVITLEYDNVILTPITALPQPNPTVQIYVSFNGFFDGKELNKIPVLPGNLSAGPRSVGATNRIRTSVPADEASAAAQLGESGTVLP